MPKVLVLPASQPGSIERAATILRRGGVVAFPTDTVYGLGAHGFKPAAIQQLYQIKERERQKAIALLIARQQDLTEVASDVPDIAWRLAERFWPGPVTLVVPKASSILDVLTAGQPSIGVRMPAHAVTLGLITALAAPLATTSANLSGHPEAITAEDVRAVLGDRIRLILDGGRCPGGVPSTVVDVTVTPAQIRRRGALANEVEAFLSEVS
jgi:L-threonylcarbamoyladenylate synthase